MIALAQLLLTGCTADRPTWAGGGPPTDAVDDPSSDTASVDTPGDTSDTAEKDTGVPESWNHCPTQLRSGNSAPLVDGGEVWPPWPGKSWSVCWDGSGEFTEIQDAIDAAADGDGVIVCPGEYSGIRIRYKSVSVAGAGPGGSVVIRGDPEVAAQPMYITDATDNFPIYLANLVWTAANITGDVWSIFNSRVIGTELSIIDNTPGASIIRVDSGYVTVDGMVVRGNSTTYSYGLLWMNSQLARVELRHCEIMDNEAPNAAWLVSMAAGSVENCIFANNSTKGAAGYVLNVNGLSDTEPVATTIRNNVFYGNACTSPKMCGNSAALLVSQGVVEGNILVNNSGGGLVAQGETNPCYNLSYNNTAFDWDIYGMDEGGDSNLTEDPLFTDPDNLDFTLQAGSPAIDAGNPDAGYHDVDGTRNDMGAFGGPLGDWAP